MLWSVVNGNFGRRKVVEESNQENISNLIEKTDRNDIKVEIINIETQEYMQRSPEISTSGRYFNGWLVDSNGDISGIGVSWDSRALEFTHQGADNIMAKITEVIEELKGNVLIGVTEHPYSSYKILPQKYNWKQIILIKHAKMYSSVRTQYVEEEK